MHPALKFILLSILVSIGVILTVFADILLKKSAAHQTGLLFCGLLVYASVAYPVALAFRLSEFGQLFLIWEAATVIVGIAIATFFFGEDLSTQRVIAVILVVAALILSYGR